MPPLPAGLNEAPSQRRAWAGAQGAYVAAIEIGDEEAAGESSEQASDRAETSGPAPAPGRRVWRRPHADPPVPALVTVHATQFCCAVCSHMGWDPRPRRNIAYGTNVSVKCQL